MKSIPFGKPLLGDEEKQAVVDVLDGPQLVHGPVAVEFENRFANRLGVSEAITVGSCTAGLHLGLHIHDIGAGDEVIVPALSHVATAHCVEYCKAKPVFVDVLPENGNINPILLPDGENIKAIIPVHYLGLPVEMDEINAKASSLGAIVIEDCAISLDATYDGAKTGGLGLMGCFSFYPTKHMTTAEGGMVTTNDPEVAAKIRRFKAFGYDRGLGERNVPGLYDVVQLGYNYRMSEVHAAIGLTQLARLDDFQLARKQNYENLRQELSDLEDVTVFAPQQGKSQSSHYCLNAVMPEDGSIDRDAVIQYLKQVGVGASIHYPGPIPLFSFYRDKYGYKSGQFPVAEWLSAQSISLPVGPHLEAGDVGFIAEKLKEALVRCRT
ncbi:DegT/DnrJ/EryC1/StrS family aminotransferase [Thalassospira alkalitolerans]|uniref:DegT/DnrJ/EryC1/StrS family aminotransferase n=1 Tax=Thalassospira alkalitolerans TaxID=1293890 RepID=UPI0030EC8F22